MEYNPAYVSTFVELISKFNNFFLEGSWWQAIKTLRLMVSMLPPSAHAEGNNVITALVEDLKTADSIAMKDAKTTEQQVTASELIKGELIMLARQRLQSLIEESGINKISQYFNYQVTA